MNMVTDNATDYVNTLLWGAILLIVGIVSSSVLIAPFKDFKNDIPQIVQLSILEAKKEININDIAYEISNSIKAQIDIKDIVWEVSKQAKDQIVIKEIVDEVKKGIK